MKLKPEVNKEAILRELKKKREPFLTHSQMQAYVYGLEDLFDLLKEETTKIEPIYPSGLREAWLAFKAYKRREGKGWYKTLASEQKAIDGYLKQAQGDVSCLIEALESSEQNRYTGVFPKPKSNSRDRSTQINATLRKGGFTI